MQTARLVASLVLAACAAGCSALLGVEEVTLDEGAGGGGGEGTWSTGPFATGAGGAASPEAVLASASAGGGGAPGTGGATTTAAGEDQTAVTSSSSAGGCVQDVPACPGVASRFEDDDSLDPWVVESPRAKISGKKLQLEPEEDHLTASVRSAAPIAAATPCAVWVTRQDGENGQTRLSLLDAAGVERLAVGWDGSIARAHVDGIEVGAVGASDAAARMLRVRLDGDGAYLAIRGADTTCWEPLAGPIPVAAPDGPVRLSYAGHGKAKLDDLAVP